jgi:hypothetical protein
MANLGRPAGATASSSSGSGLQDELTLMREREKMNNAAFSQRLAALSGGGSGAGSQVPGMDAGAADAARRAAFARAKDTAGQTARASLDALNNVLGSRGLMGSGYEGMATSNVIADTAGDINDFTREQTIQDLAAIEKERDRVYQASENEKTRDAARQNALFGLMNLKLY